MNANPRAFLYDASSKPLGGVGVLVHPDVAVFSDWPAELDSHTPFSVRLVSASGQADEWRTPREVEYLAVAGDSPSNRLAIVALTPSVSSAARLVPAQVAGAQLGEEIEKSGVRGALTALSPQTLGPLAPQDSRPASSAAVAASSAPASAATAGAPTFTVVTDRGAAQLSICRWFRWD